MFKNCWERGQSTSVLVDTMDFEVEAEKELAAFDLFAKAFQLYRADEVFLAFNGGKDCTVLLHMLSRFYKKGFLKHFRLPVLYIRDEDSFEETDKFVDDCAERYNIELIKITGPMKQVLEEFIASNTKMKAAFMGCRRSDPYCDKLKTMQVSDPGWPPLMRINPLIDWTCRDVWNYLLYHKVPYCGLYNKGYTSIGSKSNTEPNPHLKRDDGTYNPAYFLLDNDKLERAGRSRQM